MQTAVRITLSSVSPEPTYTGGPFVAGVAQLDTANPATTDWDTDYFVSCGAFGERVDIATGGNYVQNMDVEMEISNHEKWFATFSAAGASLVGAAVEIGEATSSIDMDPRWIGTVADPEFQGMNVNMRVENILATRHKEIPARILTAQEFSGLTSDAEGLPVPIIYNTVERLTLKSIRTTKYIPTTYIVVDGVVVSTWDSVGNMVVPGVVAGQIGLTFQISSGATVSPAENWLDRFNAGDSLYIEISSGTGSGQTRKMSAIGTSVGTLSSDGFYRMVFNCTPITPWDTPPDGTSVISLYTLDISEKLVIGDEAYLSSVFVDSNGVSAVVPSQESELNGIVFADISAEFKNGENYDSVKYVPPSEVWGVSTLNDLDASIPASPSSVAFAPCNQALLGSPFGNLFLSDTLCKAKIFCTEYPEGAASLTKFFALFSLKLLSMPSWVTMADLRVVVAGEKFYGDDDFVIVNPINPSSGDTFNSFSSSFVSAGGVPGNFSAYRAEVTMPLPLSSYASIRFAVAFFPTSGSQPLHNTCAVDSAPYSGGNTIDVYPAAAGYFSLNDRIRPAVCITAGTTLNNMQFYRVRDGFPEYIGGPTDPLSATDRNWRTVTGITVITISGAPGFRITLDDKFILPVDGERWRLVTTTALDLAAYEAESGIAFGFGTITPGSTFLANVSQGRTYSASWPALPSGKANGDPITLARDAALDMYYRDLALPAAAVDFASFQALPADPITSVLVDRVDSAERVASLCQQFNWIVGHDAEGRETAFAWLSRVGSTDYDLSIDTGDVVEGTLTGVSMSDIQDLVNLPNMKWSWTQADEFRSQSNVSDVSLDPLSINAGNYLQYITGFGDIGTALDVYTALHLSYQLNTYQKSGSFELPDVGVDASGVLWPLTGMSRFDWMASRKPLYSLIVPDTSAAASCIVGQRVRLRDKRYTAGAWAYGTVVEWSLDPMAAECSITIMGDPTSLDQGVQLYIDTIDPSGTVPLYIDQADGTTELYIDQTGA